MRLDVAAAAAAPKRACRRALLPRRPAPRRPPVSVGTIRVMEARLEIGHEEEQQQKMTGAAAMSLMIMHAFFDLSAPQRREHARRLQLLRIIKRIPKGEVRASSGNGDDSCEEKGGMTEIDEFESNR